MSFLSCPLKGGKEVRDRRGVGERERERCDVSPAWQRERSFDKAAERGRGRDGVPRKSRDSEWQATAAAAGALYIAWPGQELESVVLVLRIPGHRHRHDRDKHCDAHPGHIQLHLIEPLSSDMRIHRSLIEAALTRASVDFQLPFPSLSFPSPTA